MNIIEVIKTGSIINLSINGKLEKKVCSSLEESNTLFKMILEIREKPTDEAIKNLYVYLNDTTRIATIAGFEVDVINGKVYLEGFNTPVPQSISDIILEYYENGFPYQSIINFWKLLMVNPDVRVRETLFDFLTKYNFVLTENGYFVTYKAVRLYEAKNKAIVKPTEITTPVIEDDLTKVVNEYYNKVRGWKKSPKNFTVYQHDDKYFVVETKKFKGDATTIGVLSDLYTELVNNTPLVIETREVLGDTAKNNLKADLDATPEVKKDSVIYTDKHTGKMRIKLGEPVQQQRKTCDGDPSIECSYGLHIGQRAYLQHFANNNDVVLTCLINPAHVIAVPKYDHTKMRVCEYFPLAVIENYHNNVLNSQPVYFESDYIRYEKAELEKQIQLIKANQLPIESALKSEKEERSMEELLKIIESRLIDIK